MNSLTLRILGIRGVPAAHGGFETFAERLSLYLVSRGWHVVVYCQAAAGSSRHIDFWNGIERIHIPVPGDGPASTVKFDWLCISDAAKHNDLCLTLGYNTAVFCLRLRLAGIVNVINMDGIEWSRAKWGLAAKGWLWLNERAGIWFGDLLIADHPEIANHLGRISAKKPVVTIPYGSDLVDDGDVELIRSLGLFPGRYAALVARAEPENSVLEIVRSWSARRRGVDLVVLGRYDAENPYHCAVKSVASDEVKFLGAIYDRAVVNSLRFFSVAYIHGHKVGGTNPSLVEALGAGNPIIAHDNVFNRWVAGPGACLFSDEKALLSILDTLLSDPVKLREMSRASRLRHESGLTWPAVLAGYESVLRGQLRSTEDLLS